MIIFQLSVTEKWSCIVGHSLNSGPETRDPETRDPETLRSGTLGHWDPRPWDPGPWDTETRQPGTLRPRIRDPRIWDLGLQDPKIQDPYTQDPGTGTLTPRTPELCPCDLGFAILRPRILRAGLWELNLWHRFLVSRPAPQIELTLIVKQSLIIKK